MRTFAFLVAASLCLSCIALGQEESAFDKAFDLYCKGKYKEAEAEYRKALEESPDSIGANLELGRLLRELGRAQEAVPYLSTAVELAPSLGAAALELGSALVATEDWDGAEKHLLRAARLEPKDPYAWWRLGYVCFRKGKVPNAVKYLKKALALDDDLSAAWLDLGKVHRSEKEGEKAIVCLRKAVETDPQFTDAFKVYAETVVEFGDESQKAYLGAWKAHNEKKFGDAERALKALLEQEPENHRLHLLLGHVFLHQTPSKGARAVEAYDKVLELNKKSSRTDRLPLASESLTLESLGIALLEVEDFKRAKKAFTAGTKLDKEYAGHHYYLAVTAAREVKSSLLFRHLTKVRDLDVDGVWVKRAQEDEEFKNFREQKGFFEALEGK
jgi:tetratricopeptide (TPR) repeat protein